VGIDKKKIIIIYFFFFGFSPHPPLS